MDREIPKAIAQFFEAVDSLRKLGVIRSDKYLGDLAEYICAHLYDIELAASGRERGHDGVDASGKIQIKYHGSLTRTNINLGDPDAYASVLVVLGPHSLLRSADHAGDFLVYQLSSQSVRELNSADGNTFSCGKKPFARAPDRVFNLSGTTVAASSADS